MTLLEIDESCVVACDIDEALRHLSSADAIRAWFSARRLNSSVTVTTPTATVTIDDVREYWVAAQNALIVDGHLGNAHIHGHLTVRAVILSTKDGRVGPGTEIWAHVELEQSTGAAHAASVFRDIIGRGLSHLRHELDTISKSDNE